MIDCGSMVFFIGYTTKMKSINTDIDDLPVELQRANNLVEFIVQVWVVYPTYTTLTRLLSRILSLAGEL